MHASTSTSTSRVPRDFNARDFYKAFCTDFKDTGAENVSVRCPFHDDNSPSLSIKVNEGPGLWKCHGCGRSGDAIAFVRLLNGCDFETALSVVALYTPADLSCVSPPARRSFRMEDAELVYSYTDEHDTILYRIARFIPKTFRPFVPSPDGEWWVMGLPKKTRRVLYQLPEVLRVREAGGTIYLVEGEKDADSVNRVLVADDVNAIATTWTGGVPGWKDYEAGYLDTLRGAAKVIIVRDRDGEDPDNVQNSYKGQRLASHLYGVLKPIVDDVQVVEALAGKDASDHLAAGHGLVDLRVLSDDEIVAFDLAEEPVPVAYSPLTLAQCLTRAQDLPEPKYLFKGIEEGGDVLFFGPPGSGKTLFEILLALCLAFGLPLFGRYHLPRAYRVLCLLDEDPEKRTLYRLKWIAAGLGLDLKAAGDKFLMLPKIGFNAGRPDDYARFSKTIEQCQPEIVIFDSLSECSGIRDMNDSVAVRDFFRDVVGGLRKVHRFAMWSTHHCHKGAYSKVRMTDAKGLSHGSDDFMRAVQAAIMVEKVREKEDGKVRHILSFPKVRDEQDPKPIVYEMNRTEGVTRSEDRLEFKFVREVGVDEADAIARTQTVGEKAIEFLAANKERAFTLSEIQKQAGGANSTLRDALRKSAAVDTVHEGGGRGNETLYQYHKFPAQVCGDIDIDKL